MRYFFYSVLILMLLVFSAAVFTVYKLNLPAETIPEEGAVVTVSSGESLGRIALNLEEKGIIRSALFLRLLSRLKGTEQQFKSGEYMVMPGMSALEVHNIIVSGSGILVKVTIPEGRTLSQTAEIIEAANITDAESFLKAAESRRIIEKYNIPGETLEGYLYPDSYLFSSGYSAEKAVEFMVENFFRNMEKIYPDYSSLTSEDIHEKVVLASIVEREYRVADEAPLMASVFKNRLEINMPLGSCATVGYVISEIQNKPHPEFLTYDDLKIESEFNTYIRYGLPPAPICSPGKVALNAAFYPADTDYLYFLLKDRITGRHYFSRRLSEHNQARILYLK